MDFSTLMVLETRLVEEADDLTDDRPRINCSRKVAYGCGEHGQELVGGLSLHVRRLDHQPNFTCRLAISLGQEAIRSVRAELGVSGGLVEAEGALQIVSQQLLVLTAVFRIRNLGGLGRYLIYDTTDASLCMVPGVPGDLVFRTMKPVPRRTGDGRGPQLFLMARTSWLEPVKREFLCMCTLPTGAKPGSDSSVAWQIKEQRFPNLGSFSADVMFSFEGKVFWADLSQGLVFCDPEQLHRDSVVKFKFISLPKECQIQALKKEYDIDCFDRQEDEVPEPAMRSRNMVCVRGSIQFIHIDRSRGYGHEMVKLWTLNLLSQEWEPEKRIHWNELRKQVVCPEFRDLEPCYPSLLPDGTLCLLAYNVRQMRRMAFHYICSFDISSKKLLSSGLFRHLSPSGPIVLPCDFFEKCCSPPPRQSKPRTNKRRLHSIYGAGLGLFSVGGTEVREHAERCRNKSCASDLDFVLKGVETKVVHQIWISCCVVNCWGSCFKCQTCFLALLFTAAQHIYDARP